MKKNEIVDGKELVGNLINLGWNLDDNYEIQSNNDIVFELSRPVGRGRRMKMHHKGGWSEKIVDFKEKLTIICDSGYRVKITKDFVGTVVPFSYMIKQILQNLQNDFDSQNDFQSDFQIETFDVDSIIMSLQAEGWEIEYSTETNLYRSFYMIKLYYIDGKEAMIKIHLLNHDRFVNIDKSIIFGDLLVPMMIGNITNVNDTKTVFKFTETDEREIVKYLDNYFRSEENNEFDA